MRITVMHSDYDYVSLGRSPEVIKQFDVYINNFDIRGTP
jgi:hypothetical protein